MSIKVRFTDEDWNRIARDWSSWWAGELNRPLVLIERPEPPGDGMPAVEEFASSYPLTMPADAVLDRVQAGLEATRYYGDAWPKWWVNFGPGIMAGFLGVKVDAQPDTVWFSPRQDVSIQDLNPTYDPHNSWWRRVQDLTRAAVKRWGDRVQVGHTDLGGNLDIRASLHDTQRLLYELIDAPDQVSRLVDVITWLWLRYYDDLDAIIRRAGRGTTPWAPIWSPERCYMLQCDFSYMISPQMFERFVMPDLAACCDALDHAFYHMDGRGQIPHLDMLLSLERLRGIQWIPGAGSPPPERWLPLLQRIRAAGKLCQLFVTPEGALAIARELGGRGFAFSIEGDLSHDDALGLVQLLAAQGTPAP